MKNTSASCRGDFKFLFSFSLFLPLSPASLSPFILQTSLLAQHIFSKLDNLHQIWWSAFKVKRENKCPTEYATIILTPAVSMASGFSM